MGKRWVAGLLLLGSFAALLAAASASAQNETVVAAGQLPAYTFENVNLTVAFEIRLNATSVAADISDAAAFFDTASHGPSPSDYTLYPSRANGSSQDGTNFTANLSIPGGAGPIFLIMMANVSGTTLYNATEWPLAVRVQPVVTLNDSASTAVVFVGRNWSARADVVWPYGDAFDSVAIRWDPTSHGSPPNSSANYPNAYAPLTGPAGAFNFNLPAGAVSVRAFYAAVVTIQGSQFLSLTESNVSIVPEPILSRDAASPWVFVGRNATVSWSVVWPATASYPLTEVRWDTVSHFPGAATDYPNSAGATGGSGSASYSTAILAPLAPGRVYFILRATVLGEEFLARDLSGYVSEFSVEVRAEPLFQIATPTTLAFVGRAVPVEFRVVWPYATDFSLVGVYFDTASHGSPPTSTSPYPGAVAVPNVPPGSFNLSIDPPAAPGFVHFILRASVAGVDFLSSTEFSVPVYTPPAATLVLPAWELPSAIAVVRLNVTWSETFPIDLANVYYDTVSHGANPDWRLFASNSTPQSGTGRSFTFTVALPATLGSIYFVGLVRVDRYEFSALAGAPLAIVEPPTVRTPVLSPGSGIALYGQTVTVSWGVNFSAVTDVAADFRWDTRSHAGPAPSFSDYPNASTLQTKNTSSTFSTLVAAPNESLTIYGIVRVLLHGRNFYLASEVVIVVLPPPTLELVTFPASVSTGEPIRVYWRVTFAGSEALIGHTAIHWGLVSKAGQPPSLTNYPGVGGPYRGNSTNFFNATLPAQTSEGHVYFIVHALVNGIHFYLPNEFTVTIEKPAAGGGGGLLPGVDAGAALAAAAAAAVGGASARRRRR